MTSEPLFNTSVTLDNDDHPATVRLPRVDQRWHWRPDAPHASVIVRITEVVWNGEEWWITTSAVEDSALAWNDLAHFMESAVLIGDPNDV